MQFYTIPQAGDILPQLTWFRTATFDLLLTLGVLGVTLILGGLGLISKQCFYVVLWIDVWFIAHPHLAAMYTRLVMDRESFQKSRYLLTILPILVLLLTFCIGILGGSLWLITGYYFWQTWHYTRQSYGIASAVTRGKLRHLKIDLYLTNTLVFIFPIWGVLHRIYQKNDEFYGWPIYLPQISIGVVQYASIIALSTLFLWGLYRVCMINRYDLSQTPLLTHSVFILSHILMTTVSYLWVTDITQGWLFINIWHNLQYIVFVWAYNNKRIHYEVDHQNSFSFLSKISQANFKSIFYYLILCLLLGTVFFLMIDGIIELLESLGISNFISSTHGISLLLVVHLSINFHHYLVDAVIWKSKYKRVYNNSHTETKPKTH